MKIRLKRPTWMWCPIARFRVVHAAARSIGALSYYIFIYSNNEKQSKFHNHGVHFSTSSLIRMAFNLGVPDVLLFFARADFSSCPLSVADLFCSRLELCTTRETPTCRCPSCHVLSVSKVESANTCTLPAPRNRADSVYLHRHHVRPKDKLAQGTCESLLRLLGVFICCPLSCFETKEPMHSLTHLHETKKTTSDQAQTSTHCHAQNTNISRHRRFFL